MKKVFATYTGIIIAINVVAFLAFLIVAYSVGDLKATSWFALQPATILALGGLWTFITSMFLHAGVGHLAANMISLMFVGSFAERLIGKRRFLILYIVSGLLAGCFFVFVAWLTGNGLNSYAVGASGAIFGLGGLLAVLTPRLPVMVFFIIPMPMWLAMFALMGILWLLSFSLGLPIGNTAHLGGLIVGIAYGSYLRLKYPQKTQMIAKYFAK